MSRHRITIEVDTTDPPAHRHTAYGLMLHLKDRAEDLDWAVTDYFIKEAPVKEQE